MMEDVRTGRIQALIFSKLARLARNTRELLDFADYFRKFDADLVSLQESIDTSTPAGRLFYTMIAAMAQWEREEIGDRLRASIATRAKLGKPLGGRLPFGYQWKDERLQLHPEEAPVRKLVYELFAEHKRKKAVSRLLNERGLRTRNGHFTDTTVDRLIRDTTAKGLYRSNYTTSVSGNKKWAFKPEHEWVVTKVDPIVSEELWDKCNALLDARKTRGERPGPRPVHIFTGYVLCECGKKMYVPANTPKYICYSCHTKIPVVDLDGIFHEELKSYLLDPAKVDAYLSRASDTVTDQQKLLETLRAELRRVKEEMESAFRLFHANGIDVDGFKARHQPLEERRKQIEAEMPRIEGELAFLKVDGLTAEHIMADAKSFYARWPKMTQDEKRGIVESLVRSIVISKEEIAINLSYAPSSENMTERQRSARGSWPRPA